MPTIKGFSTQNPEDMNKIKGMLFREPTHEEMTAPKPRDDAPAPAAVQAPEEAPAESAAPKKAEKPKKKKKGE